MSRSEWYVYGYRCNDRGVCHNDIGANEFSYLKLSSVYEVLSIEGYSVIDVVNKL
jgi:hypothetical protein